jgi:tetratricopeptide (TPR) repeat protein
MKTQLWLAAVLSASFVAGASAQDVPAATSTTGSARQYFADAQRLTRAGQFDEARTAFAKGIALDPSNQTAVMQQAGAFMGLKRTDDALKVWDTWIELQPDDPQRWLFKCITAAQGGRPEEALKAADKVTQLQPDNADGWTGKGEVLTALNRNDEALRAFDKATILNPKHEAAWNDRGGILLKTGRYDEAIKSLDKAIALAPTWADPYFDRACAYAETSDKTNALADLKQAIALQPSLKTNAQKSEHFRSLANDPDFRTLTQ